MCLCESSESGWSRQSSWTVYSCSFTCWPSSVTVHYCSYPRLTRPSPAMPRHCPTCRWCWSSFKLVRLWWALLVVIYQSSRMLHAFSALTLLVGWQEGHPACKNWVMLQVCCCRPSGQVILIDCCSGRRMQAVPCCQHTYVAEQTLVSLSVSSGTTQVSRYQRKVKPIWNLLKQDTVSGSGISWVICKSALRSRQITTPAHHHSVFYRPDAIPDAQPTAWKHWRHIKVWALKANNIIK